MEQRLEKALLEQKGVILDGYPKTQAQCEILDAFIQKHNLKDKAVFILLDVKEEDAVERILCRLTCDECGKIYNSKFSPSAVPDTCDVCLGTLTKRIDDDAAGTIKRVHEFKDKMRPVIDYYSSSWRLSVIDGNGSPEICRERFLSFHRLQMSVTM